MPMVSLASRIKMMKVQGNEGTKEQSINSNVSKANKVILAQHKLTVKLLVVLTTV